MVERDAVFIIHYFVLSVDGFFHQFDCRSMLLFNKNVDILIKDLNADVCTVSRLFHWDLVASDIHAASPLSPIGQDRKYVLVHFPCSYPYF